MLPTWIGEEKPMSICNCVKSGICPGFIMYVCLIVRKSSGLSDNETHDPGNYDSDKNLKFGIKQIFTN